LGVANGPLIDYLKDMEGIHPSTTHKGPEPMTVTYNSRQDFSAQLARMSQPNSLLDQYMPRTLRNDSQATFERYLHGAMGYRADQSEI